MNNLLNNYIKKELDKIKWGTIQLNIKDFYKKTFIGNIMIIWAKLGLGERLLFLMEAS